MFIINIDKLPTAGIDGCGLPGYHCCHLKPVGHERGCIALTTPNGSGLVL